MQFQELESKLEFSLICPLCQDRLIWQEERLSCQRHSWPVLENVPVFLGDAKAVYAKDVHRYSRRLVSLTKEHGWQQALELVEKESKGSKASFEGAISWKKADWRHLVELNRDKVVLDIGSGWGAISLVLAKEAKAVLSMDVVFERTAFLKLRTQQMQIANIFPFCAGTLPLLPLPDNSVDVVVLNGVLEWIPASQQGRPHRVQEGSLREVYRVLKQGGFLYIGIENRWGLNYLLGDPDPHTKLRFANVLPRWIANIYSYLLAGKPFRTYTHSYSGYRKMLRKAGFRAIKMFWPYPDYRNFSELIDLEDNSGLLNHIEAKYPDSNFKRKSKILMAKSGLLKRLLPSYGILAKV